MLASSHSHADVLEVISDLSNDEVFTPPRVANAVLDLLPAEVWTDSTFRWLDPGCKTGIFLREATKRLMMGLADEFPDEQERLDHILRNMMFGVAITELTSLMSRRTVYCSKDAGGPKSVSQMGRPWGNIWFERIEHTYVNGKCSECGAAESQMKKANRENHAYALIHAAGREALSREMEMKFDVIVGNPPYQMDSDGSNRTLPLYNLFIEEAKALNPRYVAMITPARWMTSGLGLNDFRQEMLQDDRIRSLVIFPNASEVFPGVEIKGGVSYFLWDRDSRGTCDVTLVRSGEAFGPAQRQLDEHDVFIRDSRALPILRKVQRMNEKPLTEILAVDKEFGMTSNFGGYSDKRIRGGVELHFNRSGKRLVGWMKHSDIPKSEALIDTWKVLIPKAGSDGGQRLPDSVLGTPFVAPPPSACTQTYLFVFVDSEMEAASVESYVRSRFLRFLVSLRKISQDATRSTYRWVPQQTWDRVWTDEELYKKYRITKAEQEYIESMVKEMPS